MGGGSWTRNKRINDAVATRAALRPSPSAVKGKNISQVTEPPKYTGTPYQGIVAPTYSSGRTYDSPDQALAGLGSFLGNIDKSVKQTASKINYNQFDPGDFARAGYSGPSSVSNRAATEATAEYITKNKISPSIEKDGQTLYLTTGLSEDVLARTLGDDYKASGSYEAYGPVGTYSTVHVSPTGLFDSLHPALRGAIALATGGMSEAFISTTQAISGETLHLNDYLNLANAGMKIANAQQPTTSTDTTAPRTQAEMAADGDITSFSDADAFAMPEDFNIFGDTTAAESVGSLSTSIEGLPFDLSVGIGVGSALFEEDSDIGEAIQAATEAGQSTTTITDEGDVELQPTGVTPDMPETIVDLEPEFDVEPIEFEMPTDTTGGEAGGGGEPAPEPVAPTEPTEPVEAAPIAEENNWEYLGDGVFRHIETGEIRQETDIDEDVFVVGDVYSGPAPEGITETEEEDSNVIDIIGDITEDTVTDTVTDVISDVIGGGDGTGTGEGTGTGDGSGTGDDTGADTGLGFDSATRTTDFLFGDMLQLETQIGSTQERLRPFSMAPVPTTMQYDVPPVNPIQQFLQQQEALRLRNKPQGMLTNAEILKRFPY